MKSVSSTPRGGETSIKPMKRMKSSAALAASIAQMSRSRSGMLK